MDRSLRYHNESRSRNVVGTHSQTSSSLCFYFPPSRNVAQALPLTRLCPPSSNGQIGGEQWCSVHPRRTHSRWGYSPGLPQLDHSHRQERVTRHRVITGTLNLSGSIEMTVSQSLSEGTIVGISQLMRDVQGSRIKNFRKQSCGGRVALDHHPRSNQAIQTRLVQYPHHSHHLSSGGCFGNEINVILGSIRRSHPL